MDSEKIVVADGLTKHFREVKALTDFSIEVARGEVVGLLGPNGSGKSTFVRLLLGFLNPSAGLAKVMGLDCCTQRIEVHRQVSYLPGDARLFRTMRGKDVLDFFAAFHGRQFVDHANELSKRLDLDLSRWVAFMSTGMRQKLALAVVMSMDTPLIILDEPTSNLDPSVRSEVLKLVAEAQKAGKTVLFSSHVLSEIEEVCSRVVILRGGRLVHAQSLESCNNKHQLEFSCATALPDFPKSWADQIESHKRNNDSHAIVFAGEITPFLHWLSQLSIEKLTIQPLNLRSIYDQYHEAVV